MTRTFTERGSVVLVLSAAVLVIVIDARWGDEVGARRGFSQRRKARKVVGRARGIYHEVAKFTKFFGDGARRWPRNDAEIRGKQMYHQQPPTTNQQPATNN
jgi:hypothetical protein